MTATKFNATIEVMALNDKVSIALKNSTRIVIYRVVSADRADEKLHWFEQFAARHNYDTTIVYR